MVVVIVEIAEGKSWYKGLTLGKYRTKYFMYNTCILFNLQSNLVTVNIICLVL